MSEAHLSLNNVKLRKDCLLKLDMPINIELGEIRQLEVSGIDLTALDEDTLVEDWEQAHCHCN
jgi:hypothetical protein